MSAGTIRFLHAADLHLDRPPFGLAELPPFRERLADCATRAGEIVFDAALAESVDFVLLAGDVIDTTAASPFVLKFLLEQFERLAEQNIPVYWAGGKVDPPAAWPEGVTLPAGVHRFAQGPVEEMFFERDSRPIARIYGSSRKGQGKVPATKYVGGDDLISVAVAHGEVDAAKLKEDSIDYLALGGKHVPGNVATTPVLAYYAGTTQGRCPKETGQHGCTLVEIDGDRKVSTTFVPTDVLRWHDERIKVGDGMSAEQLEAKIGERVAKLATSISGCDAIVRWTVCGEPQNTARLLRGTTTAEILQRLREKHGGAKPAIWSASLSAETNQSLPDAWYEQDTIRGEYLRALKPFQGDDEIPLDIGGVDHRALGRTAKQLAFASADDRRRILQRAAALGADLLAGDMAG